jgi:hypothetical protein
MEPCSTICSVFVLGGCRPRGKKEVSRRKKDETGTGRENKNETTAHTIQHTILQLSSAKKQKTRNKKNPFILPNSLLMAAMRLATRSMALSSGVTGSVRCDRTGRPCTVTKAEERKGKKKKIKETVQEAHYIRKKYIYI